MPGSSVIASARDRLLSELTEDLRVLAATDLHRDAITLEAVDGPRVRIAGRWVTCWCSNDYLGLSTHPAVTAAAAQAAATWGVGARASRLLAGTTRWHATLEEALSSWFNTSGALVYPTGYAANMGTLGALLGPGDAVFIDRLAHASLLDAARATRATFRVFHHNDVEHLTQVLRRADRARRRLIVTEGLFSMDGDRAPLQALLQTAETCDATVYLDDAHAAFVLGAQGRGSPEAAGVSQERFLYMGTLGKALGCQGGFVVGPAPLLDWLRNRARTFIYSTALAVPIAAAACEALRVLVTESQRREALQRQVQRLGSGLRDATLCGPGEPSHIVPVMIGSAGAALARSRRLLAQGHWAPAIRPPTVPDGTARIRVSVTALHTDEQVDGLVEALKSSEMRTRT